MNFRAKNSYFFISAIFCTFMPFMIKIALKDFGKVITFFFRLNDFFSSPVFNLYVTRMARFILEAHF